jgi:hypothetical protein
MEEKDGNELVRYSLIPDDSLLLRVSDCIRFDVIRGNPYPSLHIVYIGIL